MKLDRGMKVEVLTRKKFPSGAWRCAEIMADNGFSYTVRYYRRPNVLSEVVEKVPVEAVRPCSPRAKGPLIWLVGDTVEVLDGGYWKTAEIEEVMGEDYYYIHLIGSIDEFRVEKSSIRARQEWRDNKWVLIEKGSGICVDIISKMLKKDRAQRVPEITQSVISKSLKRSAPDSSAPDEPLSERVQKRRQIQKGELQILPEDSYSFIGKVDTLDSPTENQVKNNVQNLIKKQSLFSTAIHKNLNETKCCSRTLDSEDCLSTVSSIASCSFVDVNFDRLRSPFSAGCIQDINSLCSDAESFERFGDAEVAASQSKGECAVRVHKSELYTYRYILESLYVSGPLSWKQEIILTNLRIRLDVSNDEHLVELRRLKSIGNMRMSCC